MFEEIQEHSDSLNFKEYKQYFAEKIYHSHHSYQLLLKKPVSIYMHKLQFKIIFKSNNNWHSTLVKIFKSKPNISNEYIHQGSFLHHRFQHLKGNTGSWCFHQFKTSTVLQVQHAATTLPLLWTFDVEVVKIYAIKNSSSISLKLIPIFQPSNRLDLPLETFENPKHVQ